MNSKIVNRIPSFSRLAACFVAACALLAVTSHAQTYASLPAGTQVEVRVNESLSSAKAKVGDRFTGTLAKAVVANGRTVFPKGSSVSGRIFAVERSGRLSNPGELRLELQTVRSGGRTYRLAAEPFIIRGESHTKSNVGKIGGGTAVGAIIGAIAGGGKGAAIGAGVGAATGTGVAAATGKKEATVESEAVLAWVTANPPMSAQARSKVIRASRSYPEPESSGERAYDAEVVRASDPEPEARTVRSREEEPMGFSDRDREVILGCFNGGGRKGLPPGLAKKDRLPPGLERQLQRNGTLPPGLQKRVEPLPARCEAQLPRLPNQWARVVLSGRILLLDSSRRIVDVFLVAN
jgi:hypothetical protein